MPKVVLADHHATLAESLEVVLEMRSYQVRVVPVPPEPVRLESLLAQMLALRPDVLLVNADLGPACNGAGLIGPMTRAGSAVVVITETEDEARWGECLARGARTVLPKTVSLTDLVAVVRRVLRGEPVIDADERARLVEAYRRVSEVRARLDLLTAQESAVLRHLMAGRTVEEIARVRVVSKATVRTQVKSVLSKLVVGTQLAAVAAARDAGWAPAPPSQPSLASGRSSSSG